MTALNEHILVVDDDHLIVMGFCAEIEDMGLVICGTAATADDAIALVQEHRPKVVLMDMRLHGKKDGVDAALVIHEQVGSRVIFITGSREPSTIARINLDHPWAVLFKPVSFRQLQTTIAAAMRD